MEKGANKLKREKDMSAKEINSPTLIMTEFMQSNIPNLELQPFPSMSMIAVIFLSGLMSCKNTITK